MEMTIKEFAEKYSIKASSLYQYLYRHPEIHENYTHKSGRAVFLDEQAQTILLDHFKKRESRNKEIITNNQLNELTQLRIENNDLKDKLIEIQQIQTAVLQENKSLLNDKVKNVQLLADTRAKVNIANEKSKEYQQEIERLKQELQAEKDKTWWQKLFHR